MNESPADSIVECCVLKGRQPCRIDDRGLSKGRAGFGYRRDDGVGLWRLVETLRNERVLVGEITTFNLDEYWGMAPDHPGTYRSYMNKRLFEPAGFHVPNTHLPRSDASDPMAESELYEEAIVAAGGIDLQLLGIGENGHFGFNEPTSSLTSRTRIKTLTATTRQANRAHFLDGEETPKYAITMGIGSILDARECLLLATGAGKSDAVHRMIEGPLSARCPASALQLHPRATIVLDPEAASKLELKNYYQFVHPNGEEEPLIHG